MASLAPKPRKASLEGRKPVRRVPLPADSTEPVDPVWLLKAFGGVVLAALVCGYLTLCLIFYQGQWQLVLHPSRSAPAPATVGGTPIQMVRFGVDESATPQLAGWWIPVDPQAHYAAYTVLYLPPGDGSLAGAQPTLAAIHALGLNLFAFDYRGYGQSAAIHPNQQRMLRDAGSAWQYLTVSRALPPSTIILFGDGVGSFLAAQLAAQHLEAPAVILGSPQPDLVKVILADPRVRYLPVRLLFHERFDFNGSVARLPTPKLFLLNGSLQNGASTRLPQDRLQQPTDLQLRSLTVQAASPKMITHLGPSDRTTDIFSRQLSRFLDEYLR